MPVADEQILEQNPWWRDPAAIGRDPKIRDFEAGSFRWVPPVLDAITLGPRRVHTLRGPRQVGKSTTAKRLIRRLLETGERRVLYYSFDLSRDHADVAEVVRRGRRLHPDPEGPWYLFLDEVTTMPDWQLGVKYVVDNGPAHEDFMLCTGSSAHRLGSEQLPGRKGAGRHYLQLPVSFRDFCRTAAGIPLPGETVTPGGILTPEGLRLARSLYLAQDDLERAWRAYRDIGGFPAAIEDWLAHGAVHERTLAILWDIIAGDVRKVGRDDVATLKLLERIGRSLGSPLSWQSLAGDMDVTLPTARDYVRVLAESFVLLTVFFWDPRGGGVNPQKQRKVYFIDPLVGRVARSLVPGGRAPSDSAVRENLIAVGLFRSATERLVQAEAALGSIGFWKSGRGTEVDFVTAEPVEGLRSERFPIEVKGDGGSAIANARRSISAVFGRGIVVTERLFQPDHPIPAVPAPVFLAALTEHAERKPLAL